MMTLKEAYEILGIDEERFNKIHTRALKERYLVYRRVIAEFDKGKRSAIQAAYDLIIASDAIEKHTSEYASNSFGLRDLDIRSWENDQDEFLHQKVKIDGFEGDFEDLVEKSTSDVNLSFFITGKKDAGVEPGYLSVLREDIAYALYQLFPDNEQRWAAIDKIGSVGALQKITKIEDLITMTEYQLKEGEIKANDLELPTYLVKLVYEVNSNNYIMVNAINYENCHGVKEIEKKYGYYAGMLATYGYRWAKTRHLVAVNQEATLEVLANDIARAYGMHVQDQRFNFKYTKNGEVQLLLKAKWVNGARLLAPYGGDATEKKDRNYSTQLIEGENSQLEEENGIQAISTNRVVDLHQNYALFLLQADRDGIGSECQNKLVVGPHMTGIDFGHAYPQTNPLLDSLKHDFTFDRPEYKNYSVFLDANRSELMKGVLILARWSTNEDHVLSDKIVQSYGESFYQEWSQVEQHADQKVFDDYIRKFEALRVSEKNRLLKMGVSDDKAEERVAAQFDHLIQTVKNTRKSHDASLQGILKIFAPYLNYPAHIIDMMQNIERLVAGSKGTSLRSPDGTVLLQHLRVINNPVLGWEQVASNDGSYILKACFQDGNSAKQACEVIEKQIQSLGDQVQVSSEDLSVTIKFKEQPQNTQSVPCVFSEERIMQQHHAKDYSLWCQLIGEPNKRAQKEEAKRINTPHSRYMTATVTQPPIEQVDPRGHKTSVRASSTLGSSTQEKSLQLLAQSDTSVFESYSGEGRESSDVRHTPTRSLTPTTNALNVGKTMTADEDDSEINCRLQAGDLDSLFSSNAEGEASGNSFLQQKPGAEELSSNGNRPTDAEGGNGIGENDSGASVASVDEDSRASELPSVSQEVSTTVSKDDPSLKRQSQKFYQHPGFQVGVAIGVGLLVGTALVLATVLTHGAFPALLVSAVGLIKAASIVGGAGFAGGALLTGVISLISNRSTRVDDGPASGTPGEVISNVSVDRGIGFPPQGAGAGHHVNYGGRPGVTDTSTSQPSFSIRINSGS